MTEKKEAGISWRHTSVILRADIFSKAHEQGTDISNICNKALADLTGLDYREQQFDEIPVTRPVIIAQNGPHAGKKEHSPGTPAAAHSPVINADDPASSASVRNAKRQSKAKPVPPEPVNLPAPVPAPGTVEKPAIPAAAEKTKKPAGAKTQKDEGLKKFVAIKITRSDTLDAAISKDDMYQAFTRFCREHKYAPVPDRKTFTIALKNKFAFFDKTINGVPSWVNVRLQ